MAKRKAIDPKADDSAAVETNVTAPQAPALNLQDLALTLNIMNIAIKRGAFDTKELRGVLDVYERVEEFLQFQAKAQAAAQTAAENKGEA